MYIWFSSNYQSLFFSQSNSGRFDFALESSGGTIAGTPSTETYEPTSAVFSIWGIPIWQVKNSPRQIIESGDTGVHLNLPFLVDLTCVYLPRVFVGND